MSINEALEPEQDREIVNKRMIDGPPHLVFRAWSEPRHLARWFGPHGFNTTTRSFEFRPGGVWEFEMIGPDGTVFPNWVQWIEIVPSERLHFRHGASENDPDSFLSTVTFADHDGRTEITLRALFNTRARRDFLAENFNVVEGGRETLERLDRYVEELAADES